MASCRTCKRALKPEHVGDDGNCSFCEDEKPKTKKKSQKTDTAESKE